MIFLDRNGLKNRWEARFLQSFWAGQRSVVKMLEDAFSVSVPDAQKWAEGQYSEANRVPILRLATPPTDAPEDQMVSG